MVWAISLTVVAAAAILVVWTIWIQRTLMTAKREWSREMHLENQDIRTGLNQLTDTITHALTDTRHSVQEDLKHSSLLMSNIHGKLGELAESSRHIHDIGKNIASLQELLRAPKLRGGIGEYFLEDILTQILPQNFFDVQYAFHSGQIVDAVIRMGDRLVPIDAKFPLESFQYYLAEKDESQAAKLRKEFVRTVKKYIDDIATKYILPLENTFDFALMYIPAENVYYEMMIKEGQGHQDTQPIYEYAIQKKVIPVSPNSIYAYLQVIVLGLRGFQIEGQTKEILNTLSTLKQEAGKVESEFNLVGKHLQNTTRTFDKARSRLTQFGSKINLIEDPAADPKPRAEVAFSQDNGSEDPKN